jgi:hypothetical protein
LLDTAVPGIIVRSRVGLAFVSAFLFLTQMNADFANERRFFLGGVGRARIYRLRI